MNIPVVLIIFNRPALTAQTLSRIAQAKPKTLFVIADGPRLDHPQDQEKCTFSRAAIEKINWDCEIIRIYSESNMGCRPRIVSGLNFVFEQCEWAIIVEDDCILEPSFFRYSEELLKLYQDQRKVMSICAISPPDAQYLFGSASYAFSRYFHPWGWATWRRAWQLFDANISRWGELRGQNWLLKKMGNNKRAASDWKSTFDRVYYGIELQSWDYQFFFACLLYGGLIAHPRTNLISNIGFGPDATHTKKPDHPNAAWATSPLIFPLQHPTKVQASLQLDELFRGRTDPSLQVRVRRRLRRIWQNLYRPATSN